MPEAIRIEGLEVGDTVPLDAMLKGPFFLPFFPDADSPGEWLKIEGDLPVSAMVD
jgi:hypothetical protein